ncbi:MAG: UDP-N-acetylmuramate--L-alanine ligase [Lentimicrobium sp.]|jgi:UDP-N-acetylmuramate--alanine ligase|nr:UDP-N-acetylmuramate--L-alanine ligase [Lentimicrobium sp.]
MTTQLNLVYFIGIGGIGMSAIARYLNKAGVKVYGYDKTPTPLTRQLEAEGMHIHFKDEAENIPMDTDVVVFTPAVPSDLEIMKAVKSRGLPLLKRSEFLNYIIQLKQTIAIAGTHGKTTISGAIAHIFNHSPFGCTAFLGGIAKNYQSNLILNPQSEVVVVEADEFDYSFLKLDPSLAVITAVDADHLDIYHNHEALREAFADFTGKIKVEGILLIKQSVIIPDRLQQGVKRYTYSLEQEADFMPLNLQLESGMFSYHLKTPQGIIRNLQPVARGRFNLENSIAAAAAAWLFGVNEDDICKGINSYTGVVRRFDQRIDLPGLTYLDDYAHHPKEISACIESVKEIYPGRKITGIFQPHLFTRTRDFMDEFAESLAALDTLLLLDIYPARELPIDGITSAALFAKTNLEDKHLLSREGVLDFLKGNSIDLLLTMGAGDIDQLIVPIETLLNENYRG